MSAMWPIFPTIELLPSFGFVYVLSNPAMPGLIKIGFTDRDVFARAAELSGATGVPAPFEVEAYFLAKDANLDEQNIHEALATFRLSGREFFRVPLQTALLEGYRVCRVRPAYLRPGATFETPEEHDARIATEQASLHPGERWDFKKREHDARIATEEARLEEVATRIAEVRKRGIRWIRCRNCRREWSVAVTSPDGCCPKCSFNIGDRIPYPSR